MPKVVQPKVAKVVENTKLDIIRLERRYPRAVFTADSANLGDDQKVIRVRMECFANEPIDEGCLDLGALRRVKPITKRRDFPWIGPQCRGIRSCKWRRRDFGFEGAL